MSKSDRELLELAARALGFPYDDGHFEEATAPNGWWGWMYIDSSGVPPGDSAWTELWNPLTDDGDALRLAVKLSLRCDIDAARKKSPSVAVWSANTFAVYESCATDDLYAATRRAITRAAAAIGEQMP